MKKHKNAQQIAEFALVMPVIIVIFMFIIEIGFILNARIALSESVRYSLTKVNQLVGNSDIRVALENSIKDYLSTNNLPNSDSVLVNVFQPTAGNGQETAIIRVNYKYRPVFNLLDFLGQDIFPDEFDFYSYQVVNAAIFKSNIYSSSLSNSDLDSFSTDSSLLKDQNIDGMDFRKQIAFLVGFDTLSSTDYTYARLFNWWGEDLLPPNLALNIETGYLEVKSPYHYSGAWFDTNIPYTWVLTSLGFTQAVYSRIDTNSVLTDIKLDLANSLTSLNIPLYGQSGCANCDSGSPDAFTGNIMSNTMSDNINKRTSNLSFNGTDSFGSFDPINSLSGSVNLHTIKNYTYNYNDIYILKLFVPCTAMPTDTYNGYRFQFGLTGGIYDDSGSSVNIVDCYLDSDGDLIPDAWDLHPRYPDADGNGILDGQQASVVSLITTTDDSLLYDNIDTSSLPSGTSYTVPTPSTLTIATPYKPDGTTSNPHSSNSFTPPSYSVNLIKYNTGSHDALYFLQNGTAYTRIMTLVIPENFINSNSSGVLNDSTELSNLINATNGKFRTGNKVTH